MANDIFTGSTSGPAIDWSVGTWSGDNPPTSTDTVEEQGAGVDNIGSLTLGGLVLDSGASLTVDNFLTVTGLTDTTFGGAGSILTVATGLTDVESSVTLASGMVNIDSGAQYVYAGSGATQTVNATGAFFLTGSNNDDTITLNSLTLSGDRGADNGGVVHLNGGLWDELGTGSTATIDMSGGGIFDDSTAFSGLIEGLGANDFVAVADGAYNTSGHFQFVGTPGAYSIDAATHTITFDFTTSSGTDVHTLQFDNATELSAFYISENSTAFSMNPIDVFAGGTGVGTHAWSTTSDWSTGAVPSPYAIVEQSGAATQNLPNSGSVEQIAGLILDNGANLSIPIDQSLIVTGLSGFEEFGGAGSIIDIAGTLTLGADYSTAGDNAIVGSGEVAVEAGGIFNIENAYGGTISQLSEGGLINVSNVSESAASYIVNANDTVTLNFSGGVTYTLAFGNTAGLSVAISGSNFVITSSAGPVCFASGTRIRTVRGEIAVEDLTVGEFVVTGSGEIRPVVWIGHRHIEQPRPGAWPVCVRAGAFGDGQPMRDLRLSPGHAVCVDVLGEIFTPVSGLINGLTILAEPVAEVTYWHVELESHDVLLAEGLPCESYMDAGNRAFFGRQYGRLQAVDPERVSESLTRYARPFVNDEATVAALRRRLEARARRLFDCRLNRTAVSMLRRFGA